jgi:hypothetical protein
MFIEQRRHAVCDYRLQIDQSVIAADRERYDIAPIVNRHKSYRTPIARAIDQMPRRTQLTMKLGDSTAANNAGVVIDTHAVAKGEIDRFEAIVHFATRRGIRPSTIRLKEQSLQCSFQKYEAQE